ncbi:MAG: hypothetical protein ACTHN8_16720 [Angustibacter sp.]
MAHRLLQTAAACVALLIAASTGTATLAQAAEQQDALVPDTASPAVPGIVGGQCYGSVADPTACRRINAMVKIGPWVYAGGVIDVVDARSGGVSGGWSNLMRFNAITHAVDKSFKPQLFRTAGRVDDASVLGLAATADGTGLYVSGRFLQVSSGPGQPAVTRRGLVLLDAETGAVRTSFDAKVCAGGGGCMVSDVRLVAGRSLWIGGDFTRVAGVARTALASLNPTTGALTSAVNLNVSGRAVSTTGTKVVKIKPDPSSTRAVILGNFTSVDGRTREEVAMVDVDPTDGSSPGVDAWYAPKNMHAAVVNCNKKMYWPRDADWSPDGSTWYLVGSGGGGGHPYPAPCDALTSWASDSNPDATPIGYNHTEIDTILSVCVVGRWAYLGGHFKSLNQERRLNGVLARPPAGQVNETHYGLGVVDVSPKTFLAVTDWNHTDQTGRGAGWGAVLCVPGPGSQGGGVYFGGDAPVVNGDHRILRLAYFPSAG